MNRLVRRITIGCFLACTSLLSLTARGQSPDRADPAILAIDGTLLALSVADLDASSRWYSEKLGLKTVLSSPPSGGVSVRVLEGGGLIVELVHQDSAVPAGCGTTDPALCHGLFKVGVLVKDLGKTLEKLAGRGVPVAFGPFPAQPNQRANAIIRDNAGNLIQILQR
ncbi:MAG TPA: VOC family protein [Candidatus Polarisedimenticolia bacterium]|nr:VOC family protein [Candidatus Polarisedimenticolia bacterium]